jgi:hypothetical protein
MGHTLTLADRQKGASVANALKRARRQKLTQTAAEAYALMDSVGREGVTVGSVVATLGLSQLLINHEVAAPTTASELEAVAKALKIAHTIMRLEHGESTSNSATAHVDLDQLADKVSRLRDAPPAPGVVDSDPA